VLRCSPCRVPQHLHSNGRLLTDNSAPFSRTSPALSHWRPVRRSCCLSPSTRALPQYSRRPGDLQNTLHSPTRRLARTPAHPAQQSLGLPPIGHVGTYQRATTRGFDVMCRAHQPFLVARYQPDMRTPRIECRRCGATRSVARVRDHHRLARTGSSDLPHACLVPEISVAILRAKTTLTDATRSQRNQGRMTGERAAGPLRDDPRTALLIGANQLAR
jgi:hypothetical protein